MAPNLSSNPFGLLSGGGETVTTLTSLERQGTAGPVRLTSTITLAPWPAHKLYNQIDRMSSRVKNTSTDRLIVLCMTISYKVQQKNKKGTKP